MERNTSAGKAKGWIKDAFGLLNTCKAALREAKIYQKASFTSLIYISMVLCLPSLNLLLCHLPPLFAWMSILLLPLSSPQSKCSYLYTITNSVDIINDSFWIENHDMWWCQSEGEKELDRRELRQKIGIVEFENPRGKERKLCSMEGKTKKRLKDFLRFHRFLHDSPE